MITILWINISLNRWGYWVAESKWFLQFHPALINSMSSLLIWDCLDCNSMLPNMWRSVDIIVYAVLSVQESELYQDTYSRENEETHIGEGRALQWPWVMFHMWTPNWGKSSDFALTSNKNRNFFEPHWLLTLPNSVW